MRSLFFIVSFLIAFGACQEGIFEVAKAVYEIVKESQEKYHVVVVNNCSNSIFLKCASGDNAIEGSGSDSDDWWTLQSGDALGWSFGQEFGGRTCFWCYANNNGADARSSGNWYIHQDVWSGGTGSCDNAPANIDLYDDVTSWQVRDDGMYSDQCDGCNSGDPENPIFEQYSSWGPSPN